MALPEDVFLVEDANNDDADWDDDRPEAEPPPSVSAMPIEDHIMTWDDAVVSMKHDFKETSPVHPTPSQSMHIEFLEEDLDAGFLTSTILPSECDYHVAREVAQQQMHLPPSQRNDPEAIFLEHQTLFPSPRGTVGSVGFLP